MINENEIKKLWGQYFNAPIDQHYFVFQGVCLNIKNIHQPLSDRALFLYQSHQGKIDLFGQLNKIKQLWHEDIRVKVKSSKNGRYPKNERSGIYYLDSISEQFDAFIIGKYSDPKTGVNEEIKNLLDNIIVEFEAFIKGQMEAASKQSRYDALPTKFIQPYASCIRGCYFYLRKLNPKPKQNDIAKFLVEIFASENINPLPTINEIQVLISNYKKKLNTKPSEQKNADKHKNFLEMMPPPRN